MVRLLAAVAGVPHAINGATQAGGYVEVPVLAGRAALEVAGERPDGAKASVLIKPDSDTGGIPVTIPGAEKGNSLAAGADGP